jgi:hypothetical protein
MIRRSLRVAVLWTTWGLCLSPVLAQIAPLSSDIVNLNGTSFQATVAPSGQTITLVNVTVDSSSLGGDQIEVIAGDDPAGTANTVPSLILPSGVEVTSANSASFGFTFLTYSFTIGSYADFPSLASDTGTHTVIQFPAVSSSGVYQVKIDGSQLTSDVAIKVVTTLPPV